MNEARATFNLFWSEKYWCKDNDVTPKYSAEAPKYFGLLASGRKLMFEIWRVLVST